MIAGNGSRGEASGAPAAAAPPASGGGSEPTISASEPTPAGELVSPSPLPPLKDGYFQDSNRDGGASSLSGMGSDDYEYDYTTDSDDLGSNCADSARGKVAGKLACVLL